MVLKQLVLQRGMSRGGSLSREHMRTVRRPRASLLAFAAAMIAVVGLGLTGCGITIPADPDGALERIEGNVLRAGASLHAQLIEPDGDTATGPLADFVEDFASDHDAEVEWRFGSEEVLVRSLEEGELDMVVGGITADTPWVDRVGVTREHAVLTFDESHHPVVLVPMGENRLLFALEAFIDERAKP